MPEAPASLTPPSPEALECYRWFATLGFPDFHKSDFVCYTDGRWHDGGNGRQLPVHYGFLVADEGPGFRILTNGLDQVTLTKTGPDCPAFERIGWVVTDFVSHARSILEEQQKPGKSSGIEHFLPVSRLSKPAEIFSLATASWQRGQPGLSQQLFDEAVKAAKGKSAGNFRPGLEQAFGHTAMWRAIVAFGGEEWPRGKESPVSRKELLLMVEAIPRLYPGCAAVERAKETAGMLRLMIAEDESHPPVTEEELGKMSPAGRAAELIFRLRDQNGHQYSQPGWCCIFDENMEGSSAAHRLVEMGMEAVPRLMSALKNKRFTRSTGFHRDYYFSHQVLTVGDCAVEILERIAGRSFRTSHALMKKQSRGPQPEVTILEKVHEWWTALRGKGATQVLRDLISSGEANPGAHHAKLLMLDPAAVVPALLSGATRCGNPRLKWNFFLLLVESGDPRAIAFVHRRMREEDTVAGRVFAIKALARSKHPKVLEALLREWAGYDPPGRNSPDPDRLFETMAELLGRWRGMESTTALGAKWDTLEASRRRTICDVLSTALGPHGFSGEPADREPVSPEVVAAGERILAKALEEVDVAISSSGCSGEWHYTKPSVATIANHALHRMKPGVYPFSNKASMRQRETERLTAMDIWRKANGLRRLALPSVRLRLAPGEALKIVEVKVKALPGKAGKWLRDAALALEHTNFEATLLPRLCDEFVALRFPGNVGLSLRACRDDDFTGVMMTMTLVRGPDPDEIERWNHSVYLMLAGRILHDSSGSTTRKFRRGYLDWGEVARHLESIVRLAPETEFECRFFEGRVE